MPCLRGVAELHGLFHLRRVEVADPDVANLAGLVHFVESADALGHRHVAAARPVQEKQVDLVGPQLLQAFVDRGEEVAMGIFVDPDLGGEEDIGA